MKPSCTTALCFLNASPRFWRHYPVTTGSGIWSEQGEYQRRVLDIFREAQGAALSSRQIGAALVARQGLESTTAMIEPMQKNAIVVVHRLERTGTLIAVGRDGHGATWSFA